MTDKQVKAWLARADKGGALWDGEGLHLRLTPAGTPVWRIKYRFQGRENMYTAGHYPMVTLAQARSKMAEVKRQLLEGRNPAAERDISRAHHASRYAQTFAQLAEQWLQMRKAEWSEVHFIKSQQALERDIYPVIGHLPVESITAPMVALAVERVHLRGATETAARILFHVRAIFRFVQAKGIRLDNPADPVQELLPRKRNRSRMKALLQPEQLRAVLRKAACANLSRSSYLAHLLCAYSAARISNVVTARWEEMNLETEQPIWTIPREKMKVASRELDHRIPLAGGIVAELKQWRRLVGSKGYCFPGANLTAPVTRETVEKAYRVTLGLADQHTPHGWRSAFSTLSREAGFAREVVELALDHVHDDEVALAYDRGERFDQRIALYRWWAQLLEADQQ